MPKLAWQDIDKRTPSLLSYTDDQDTPNVACMLFESTSPLLVMCCISASTTRECLPAAPCTDHDLY